MTGQTPAAASNALRRALQVTLSSVSTAVLRTDTAGPATLLTARDRLARSSSGHIGLFLLHASITVSDATQSRSERWQTRTVGYEYRLEDVDGREIIAYHWHPYGESHVTIPHFHLGAALGQIRLEMTRAHLQTGLITPVAVLAVAVEQFAVVPRRTDWAVIFEQTARDLASG